MKIERVMSPFGLYRTTVEISPDRVLDENDRLNAFVRDLWTMHVDVTIDRVLETGQEELLEFIWSRDPFYKKHLLRGLRACVGVGSDKLVAYYTKINWVADVVALAFDGSSEIFLGYEDWTTRLESVADTRLYVDVQNGDDRASGTNLDDALATYAEMLRRTRPIRPGEVYVQEMSPWGPRLRGTDRFVASFACPEISRPESA